MYLIDDDEPNRFDPRLLHVLRSGVCIGEKEGVVVGIVPSVTSLPRGPLAEAVLVARHRDVDIQRIARGEVPRPLSVFVCRFPGTVTDLPSVLRKEDVSIELWGRVISGE